MGLAAPPGPQTPIRGTPHPTSYVMIQDPGGLAPPGTFGGALEAAPALSPLPPVRLGEST